MSTFASAKSAVAAVSDLRAWSEKQLIAAAKSGRRAPFGELCEQSGGSNRLVVVSLNA